MTVRGIIAASGLLWGQKLPKGTPVLERMPHHFEERRNLSEPQRIEALAPYSRWRRGAEWVVRATRDVHVHDLTGISPSMGQIELPPYLCEASDEAEIRFGSIPAALTEFPSCMSL